jgi:hypothetical protein
MSVEEILTKNFEIPTMGIEIKDGNVETILAFQTCQSFTFNRLDRQRGTIRVASNDGTRCRLDVKAVATEEGGLLLLDAVMEEVGDGCPRDWKRRAEEAEAKLKTPRLVEDDEDLDDVLAKAKDALENVERLLADAPESRVAYWVRSAGVGIKEKLTEIVEWAENQKET